MTSSEDCVAQFHALFRGRNDAYGAWNGMAVRQPLTAEVTERHLTSDNPQDWIGTYPLGHKKCMWGCIDIDGGDFPREGVVTRDGYDRKDPAFHDWQAMFDLGVLLVDALRVIDVHAYLERTRNGYHVWVFPEDPPIVARIMRRALMAACQVVGYDPKEVNPKQETLEGDKLGNYVRLPYYGALAEDEEGQPDRYFVTLTNQPLNLRQFLTVVERTPVDNLRYAAGLWKPPVVEHVIDTEAGLEAEPLLYLLDGLAYTIWKDGPLPGKDRSSTLVHLAHLCAERGLTAQQTFTVVRSADQRHGRKFADREDGDERIMELVERTIGAHNAR